MAVVLLRGESHRRAEGVLGRFSLRPYLSRHNAARVRLLIGQAASRRGDTATARRAFGQALDTLGTLAAVVDEAEALGALGDLEAQTGHASAAESLYERGLARIGARQTPESTWPLHAGLASVLRSRGALEGAAAELQVAIGQIERVAVGLPLEEHRSAFLEDKWGAYVELALVERARGRTEAAFEGSERLRARQMLDLLARGRVTNPSVAGGEWASREQDLRRRIAELTRQVERPEQAEGGGLRDPAATEAASAAVSDALTRAQEAYGALLVEMREANPAYAALVRGEIAPAGDVRAALMPDEALLEYLVGDSTTIVFVVTSDSLVALDLNVSHSALVALVDFARSTLASPTEGRSEERRVGKECRSRWSPYH